jgi:hypothetical protein
MGKMELSYTGVVMNIQTCRVSRDGENINPGPTEFSLIKIFLVRSKKSGAETNSSIMSGAMIHMSMNAPSMCTLGCLRKLFAK